MDFGRIRGIFAGPASGVVCVAARGEGESSNAAEDALEPLGGAAALRENAHADLAVEGQQHWRLLLLHATTARDGSTANPQ